MSDNFWIASEDEKKFKELINAKYQFIYTVTHEEDRLERLISQISEELSVPLYTWSFTSGLQKIEGYTPTSTPPDAVQDPHKAIQIIQKMKGEAIFLLKDFHVFIQGGEGFLTIRALRDYFFSSDSWNKSIVVSSPVLKLPPELEKHADIVEFDLPDDNQIGLFLDSIYEHLCNTQNLENNGVKDRSRLIGALKGLTKIEIETVIAKSITSYKELNYDVFVEEKRQILKKSGSLDYHISKDTLDDVGGLDNLKQWLKVMKSSFEPGALEFGVDSPKGVLLLGLPGTGKSLSAKATAKELGLPLIQFDLSRVMGSLYGQSEANMRSAIRVIEAVAPVVVMIDEIEKVLSGSGSSNKTDGGTTDHLMGMLLNWMQEREKAIFFVGTANSLDTLPDHLVRAGRFDSIFFVDLPNSKEREEIVKIHLAKRNREPDFDLASLISKTEGFSGAELEQVVKEAIRTVWYKTKGEKDITLDDLIKEAEKITPLSITKKEEIEVVREKAKQGRIQLANKTETEEEEKDFNFRYSIGGSSSKTRLKTL